MKKNDEIITDLFISKVCGRLAENLQVRRTLPEWGRVNIDRQLPFLCIYRRGKDKSPSLSDSLITGEASYLTAIENRKSHKQLSSLVKNIVRTLKENFGSFLVVEVWVTEHVQTENELPDYNGAFKIIAPKKTKITSTIESLEQSLKKIKIRRENATVEVIHASKITPPGLPPLITYAEAEQLGCHVIGVEISSIYLDRKTGEVFPLIFRKLKKSFTRALQNSFFEFTRSHTPFRPPHFHSLGRRSMVKAVWETDTQLAEICNGFDFLLQVTPINIDSAWSFFQRSHYEKKPHFIYRPLSLDPATAKRQLFQIQIERIEDSTLAQLLREHQLELDRKFTMLIDRNTERFIYGSLQLYGAVDDSLMKLATDLIEQLPPRSRDESSGTYVDALSFAERANEELAYYRTIIPESKCKVVVREDITGLMVSNGNLLIGAKLKIPATRIEALIAHEVGTHVLTYLNGKSQPLQQLYIGFPGYDELQEGLAVLSEYLVGGLTKPRMRLLAARVVAARQMIDGASFVDVFRHLNYDYGFERRTAFNIVMRTFRGGGLTKDAVYLRGLVQLLEYLKNGGALEPLFVGKISADHVPIINELQWRKVLHPTPLRPRFLSGPDTNKKLNDLKSGLTPMNLIQRSKI
ncbi:MAG: flavohemoglobin expression-modulating QEGLA motif protein [Bacteroidetes bacterium]|nr:flavohemoglobin expression-modulating QEGLA motif protein [Bacteroidota bacterium]